MRLGQLARKVSVHSSEIVSFLAGENIVIEEGTNTRIEEEQVKLVYARFAPELLNAPASNIEEVLPEEISEVAEPEPIIESGEIPVVEEIRHETIAVDVTMPMAPESQDITTEDSVELPDVIKAPKVELKGLTVLGKIELPSAKKKEETPVTVEGQADDVNAPVVEPKPQESPRREKRSRHEQQQRRQSERPRKNPVAVQREREAREAEERRKEAAIRQKESRTLYYQNRVKPAVPTKAARIVNEPLMEESAHNLREEPKTLLGKFLRWLTT